eukprot:TRINITY_DN28687_c0_g3_i2.p1 TRINITY_DN28687_c0_g3~~TRINITY_DN28687_c0_g3_i2.p1  ORF type:complete len:294 (-),score=30.72 TRINITY_DN28687_c0_g3_i2:44-925(-)
MALNRGNTFYSRSVRCYAAFAGVFGLLPLLLLLFGHDLRQILLVVAASCVLLLVPCCGYLGATSNVSAQRPKLAKTMMGSFFICNVLAAVASCVVSIMLLQVAVSDTGQFPSFGDNDTACIEPNMTVIGSDSCSAVVRLWHVYAEKRNLTQSESRKEWRQLWANFTAVDLNITDREFERMQRSDGPEELTQTECDTIYPAVHFFSLFMGDNEKVKECLHLLFEKIVGLVAYILKAVAACGFIVCGCASIVQCRSAYLAGKLRSTMRDYREVPDAPVDANVLDDDEAPTSSSEP